MSKKVCLKPLHFEYNFNAIQNLFIPNRYSFPETYTIIGSCIGTMNNDRSLTCSFNFNTNLYGNFVYEYYSVSVFQDQKTLGTLSWVFNYLQPQKSTAISQTLQNSLEGNISSASGIFESNHNARVKITYNNINGSRKIFIQKC